MTTLRDQDKVEIRDGLLQLLRSELIGPCKGGGETLKERPDKRYLMGTLFPRNATASQVVREEVTSAEGDLAADGPGEADEGVDSPTDLMFQRLPASVGVSFAVGTTGDLVIDVRVRAATYDRVDGGGKGRQWQRKELGGADGELHRVELSANAPTRFSVLEGRASIHGVLREGPEGSRIITLSLINEREIDDNKAFQPDDCLFQIGLEAVTGFPLKPWPTPERLFNDEEDDELALQYRHKPVIAVGHGCAADWELRGEQSASVRVEFLPTVEIAPITADIAGLPDDAQRALSLQYIQSPSTDDAELIGSLSAFVNEYAAWKLELNKVKVPASATAARDRILSRIERALGRMRAGIELLSTEPQALQCFKLANRAMLIQMVYAGRVNAAEKGKGPSVGEVDPDDARFAGYRWRPFQLAFQLLSLNGLWSPDHADRDIVDLIWFPTGGGKTEAYLAAAGFEMMRRRMAHGTAGLGTAVLMRYTLRLLTQQQFQRAGHLICALESLRQDLPELGDTPFSLGLWVGNKVTPGSASEAYATYDSKLRQEVGAVSNPFTLLRCPACGTPIVPPELKEQGAHECGIRATNSTFEFYCPDETCAFHELIPVQIVDDLLYASPPTMLMGTLDKFAMTAWKDDAGRFFGRRGKREDRVEPPSLIIQDELHLISGPLGTIAGLYEAAIDVTIASLGQHPKVIASTATTRRVSEQARALYAREVDVFPPAGLDAGESFFSTVAQDSGPGRLYVGAMAQGHTPTFSNVLVSAALLSSVPRLDLDEKIEDGWWTLVAYHNSRRELGRSLTLARDDIPARIAALYRDDKGGVIRQVADVEELSANIRGEDIPLVLERLGQPKCAGAAVDYLGCTNMLSVGVDVDRLGLMLVLGQPKTASEYIQATSRVGRDRKFLPGVVLSLYMPTKPRDRSHYELFRPFHEAMYRHVEPSSVTPYALPARARAFHSALVSAVRMATSLNKNSSAADFDRSSGEIRAVLESLYERMKQADETEELGIAASAKQVEDWWTTLASGGLRYSGGGARNYRPLLKRFGDPGHPDAKETLQSMRHVDSSVRVKIVGRQEKTERSGS